MYNEEEVIELFFRSIKSVLNALAARCEIVCVNDGSSDRTLNLLLEFASRDRCIVVINLSRNFGKEAALSAGSRGPMATP